MGNPDVGQPLFQHYRPGRPLHDVHIVYVPISNFPHLQKHKWQLVTGGA